MNENKLIEEFWHDCDDANFSKEATVLFFYLIKLSREKHNTEIKMHPAKLSSVVKGLTPTSVNAASQELQARGYVRYIPATEDCSSGIYHFLKGGKASTKKEENRRNMDNAVQK